MKAFISYSHKDEELREQFEEHLALLRREELIDDWTDRKIVPGQSWEDEIKEALEEAEIILLLISASFVNSDFCFEKEMRRAIERHEDQTARVIPIIVRPCDWQSAPFGKLQGLPKDAKPVTQWSDPDSAWLDVVKSIRSLVEARQSKKRMKSDAKTRKIDQSLRDAYARRKKLLFEEAETQEIDQEILSLKRQRRAGRRIRSGDVLGERFELHTLIGQGGFAQVWKALDERTQELVAVKVLHSQHNEERTRRERFFRGAREMAKLQHPGIVRVIEPEMEDDELYFFVMEYLSGGDLRQAVLSKRLDPDARRRVLVEVGEALTYAHDRGLVHRDVKPGNILLDADECAKLTDFDLVRALDTTGGTQRTQGMGTFVYAAPEALEHAADADARADVYGLAMTAIFVLGEAPLKAKQMLRKPEKVVEKLDVPTACREALLRGIEWEPEDRPESVQEFCEALSEAFMKPVAPGSIILTPKSDLERLFTEIKTQQDGVVPLWRAIPAGEFMMGEDSSPHDDEKPAHRVEMPHGFSLAATPVTNAQYAAFKPEKADGSRPNHPVVNVSWIDAMKFCEWLSKKFDWMTGARLPTEEEWEYACRAGTTTRYWSGADEDDLARVGWYDGNSGGKLHRVGEKLANAWGLYDVHGNVLEWTLTEWSEDKYEKRSKGHRFLPPAADLAELDPGVRRVFRGGSYWGSADGARSACRDGSDPGFVSVVLGFRVLRPSVPELDH